MPEKHFVSLRALLPNIKDDQDQCVEKLQSLLISKDTFNKVHISREKDETGLCIHYDPNIFTLDRIKGDLALAGARLTKQYLHESLHIEGMDSPDCGPIIEHLLMHLSGILVAKVSYTAQQLRLEIDKEKISIDKIIRQLKRHGYRASRRERPRTWIQQNLEVIFSVTAGVLLLISWLVSTFSTVAATPTIVLIIDLAAFASAGWLVFRDSIETLMQKRLDIDVLMVLAAFGAGILGAWGEGALLLFLFSLGHALEHKALDRARDAVKSLAKLAPKTATVKRDGIEREILVEELARGDIVLIKPGQSVPVDGTVLEGTSSVDQSPITGESIPVDKTKDDIVFAGSINSDGALIVRVDKLSEETTLSRMVRMVLEADTQQSPTQLFTARFVRYFVPTILIAFVALIIIPPLFGESWADAFYRAISLLVASSPCALAIATPAAVLSGVARAASKGVLIKGGMHLENLGIVKIIAFDKTGTLTVGKPHVQAVLPMGTDEATLLSIAASLEALSGHPLAKAIIKFAEQKQLPLKKISDMQSITGRGVKGNIDGKLAELGSLKMFEDTSTIQSQVDEFQNRGYTTIIVRFDGKWLGLIGVADSVRPEASAALAALRKNGIRKTIMLTGDNERVAAAIAKQIGVTDFRADLLPEDKLVAIRELAREEKYVAMVGDGVNDAPALAQATVGIAMGGAGTDVALETADIALMADDLSNLPFAVHLSRASRRVIRQNLWMSLGIVGLLIVGALTGVTGLTTMVLIHEGSTLVVVGNALRLLRA
ncbi:MAG: cadmium-transporting ATPase [Gammaproteobacteria bacterium RIFCSPHIGHO2_12_FULL_37_14]|nr:MAG: cadmium-transporting ATPase [Gammaproteobacteria bacterium RIFCSPHIGHO2_12_FULL_37_14]